MKDDTTSIILIFLIFIFLIWMIHDKLKNKKWFIEAMSDGVRKKVILMGDGFLNNNNYVEPPDDIKTIITNQNGLVLAKKKTTIKDLERQLISIPEKYNQVGTTIFISAGGMDLKNNYRYGSGMWNGGLNEGYADIWAISLTQSPVLGFGWDLVDPTVYVRRYDQNRKVYPQDLVGQVHADGEIIAGAFWDTYLNLGSMQQMLDLFKYTFDGAPDGPNGTEGIIYTDVLVEVLFADDNDADLTNGTPRKFNLGFL